MSLKIRTNIFFYSTLKLNIMKSFYTLNSILLLLFITNSQIILSQTQKFELFHKKNKEVFTVQANSVLSVNNQYGDIKIYAWNRDSIQITTTIWIDAPTLESAEEVFNQILISNTSASRYYNYETILSKNFFSYFSYGINYEIFAPKDIELNLKNKIGNIELFEIGSKINSIVEYGNFSVINQQNSISNSNISVSNGNLNVKNIDNSIISHKNGELFSDKMSNTILSADFSKIQIENMSNLKMQAQTSNINILNSNDLEFKMSSCNLSISILEGKSFIESFNFSDIKINKLNSIENEVVFIQDYSNLTIGIPSSLSYTLHGEIENGEINHYQKGKLKILKENNKHSFSGDYELKRKPSSIIIFGKNSMINIVKP